MRTSINPVLISFALLLCALPALARDTGITDQSLQAYEARTHTSPAGGTLSYRLLVPKSYDPKAEPKKQFPLILFLHGAGERGTDNKSQLRHGGGLLAGDLQAAEPCFVLAPQCPPGKQWVNTPWGKGSYSAAKVAQSDELRMALEALTAVRKEFPIDPSRVYVMGLSMGGYGTWDAAQRNPGLFAAAVPICGAGDPSKADALKQTAVWAFHGGNDTVVPTQGSRDMAEALKKAGANEDRARYTEFPGVGHNAWSKAWDEPKLIEWLLARRLGGAGDAKPAATAK